MAAQATVKPLYNTIFARGFTHVHTAHACAHDPHCNSTMSFINKPPHTLRAEQSGASVPKGCKAWPATTELKPELDGQCRGALQSHAYDSRSTDPEISTARTATAIQWQNTDKH